MDVKVCVLGSLNMDLVVHAAELPRPGETVLGGSFAMHPGGKGANQAVGVARLGGRAALIGAVGRDEWGTELRSILAAEGVDIEHVLRLPDVTTGVAVITVAADGENTIVVAGGANLALTVDHVEAAREEVEEADVLLLQNEVPRDVNLRAAQIAAAADVRVILNAAPAVDLDPALAALLDVLVVNEAEARTLAGVGPDDDVSPAGMARRLAAKGPDLVAVTLGAEGALFFDGEKVVKETSLPVEAIDAVGAGDAFVAALVVAHKGGQRLSDSLRVACAAGALATTVAGALPSLPRRDALDAATGKPAEGA